MSTDEPRRFPTTAWSMVQDAKLGTDAERATALDRFACSYWRPVYFFLRARGIAADSAQDVVQEFFLKFLERNWITRADPARGKFRTYVLTTLKGFLADQSPERGRRQPHFESRIQSLPICVSESDREFEPSAGETPDQIFMRSWAEALIAKVGDRLETELHSQGRRPWYEAFRRLHLADKAAEQTQELTARSLGMTRDQLRYAVKQVQRRYSELLREEIADQVTDDCEVDAELRELFELLQPNG